MTASFAVRERGKRRFEVAFEDVAIAGPYPTRDEALAYIERAKKRYPTVECARLVFHRDATKLKGQYIVFNKKNGFAQIFDNCRSKREARDRYLREHDRQRMPRGYQVEALTSELKNSIHTNRRNDMSTKQKKQDASSKNGSAKKQTKKQTKKQKQSTSPKPGEKFVATYKGKTYTLTVGQKNGDLVYRVGKKEFATPSAAGTYCVGHRVSGPGFWGMK